MGSMLLIYILDLVNPPCFAHTIRVHRSTGDASPLDPHTLVIFDYSGTLSLGAVDFGRPGQLERHLAASGLAGIGIDTIDRYWQAVVKPTWAIASTTRESFQSLAVARIREMDIPGAEPRSIESAVAGFIDAYMRHSDIDARWQPLLADIQQRPDVLGLIATDHYAEATNAILSHLAALGIAAATAAVVKGPPGRTAFRVANSADIGSLKADVRFWAALKKTCLPMPLNKIIMVDDFGSNEQDQSGYADTGRIEARLAATCQVVGRTFGREPQVVHYLAGEDPGSTIAATIETVRKTL